MTVALIAMNADVYAFTELEYSAGNSAVKDVLSRLNGANISRQYEATKVLAKLDTVGGDQIKAVIVLYANILTDDQIAPGRLSNSTLGRNNSCASRALIAASLMIFSS